MSAPVYGLAWFALYLFLALITIAVIGYWTSRPPKPIDAEENDERPHLDQWRDKNATAETQLYNVDEDPGALALVRPKPYPPLKSVKP